MKFHIKILVTMINNNKKSQSFSNDVLYPLISAQRTIHFHSNFQCLHHVFFSTNLPKMVFKCLYAKFSEEFIKHTMTWELMWKSSECLSCGWFNAQTGINLSSKLREMKMCLFRDETYINIIWLILSSNTWLWYFDSQILRKTRQFY